MNSPATTTTSPLSWTPRRRGKVYCSPACGGGCTWADYRRASRRAEDLAVALGPGWSAVVWENLGWFWKAANGNAEVRPEGDRFSAKITMTGHQFLAVEDTPRDAIGVAACNANAAASMARRFLSVEAVHA